jgi:hypothetical protein
VTVLDDILSASTDPSVPTSDLLRKVQIAATRLGAREIVEWARNELGGYPDEADLPPYRHHGTGVMGLFTGPMQSQVRQPLTVIPPGMADRWTVDLRQPIVELQSLADETENDPQVQWPAWAVNEYERTGAYTIQFHNLFSAWNVITRQSLRGIIDVVRSRAMEFALELQVAFPDAGEVGGPTVASTPALAQTVYNITNNITGHGTNIAAGPGATQTSTVNVGDEAGLRARLEELGIPADERDEFVAAVQEDGTPEGPRTTRFLDRVRSGAILLGTGLATDVAAEALVAAARGFLGI